ncbi:MAG TPA: Xaa-Pro peptidase family protein [Thermoleophilaceae bacterium]
MSRADRVEALLADAELDALLVTNLENVRYLTGYTGTNGVCVIGPDLRAFFTDFRYVAQAERQVHGFDRALGKQDLLGDAAGRLSGRVGIEDYDLSVRRHERLRGLVGEGVELVPAGRCVERVRAVKEPEELDRVRAAAALADELFRGVVERGLIGRSEREIAFELETEMRRRGAAPSFPAIIAGGPNGALPHAEPGEDPIARDTLVVFDWGVELDGYCSDCTRTLATGSIPDDLAEVYELVRATQVATLDEVRPGAAGAAVDGFARERIAAGGHGERFGHGLGHGVGIVVHEGPTLSKASEDTLVAGNVVTVEPGVYVPDAFGVRIEDLVVVADDGPEILSGFPKGLTEVG